MIPLRSYWFPSVASHKLLNLSLLALLASSCARTIPPQRADLPSPDQVHSLLEGFRVRGERVQGLRGLASIEYGTRFFGAPSDAVILLNRPSRLKVSGLSPFGFYDYELALEAGDLTVYWAGQNRYVKGLASTDRMEEFLSLSLEPEEVIDILVGRLPLEGVDEYRPRLKKGRLILVSSRTEVTFENDLPVEFRRFGVDGSTQYDVSYPCWEEDGGLWVPCEVEVRFRDPKGRIRIRFRSLEVNPSLERADFLIQIPEDAEPL